MATHDVTTFVQALKEFHEQLPPVQRAMLEHLIDAAQGSDDTAGYLYKKGRTEQSPTQDDDTAGYYFKKRTESEQDDDTVGYGRMIPNMETGQMEETAASMPRTESAQTDAQAMSEGNTGATAQGDDERWTSLAAWLSRDDDTAGYRFRYS